VKIDKVLAQIIVLAVVCFSLLFLATYFILIEPQPQNPQQTYDLVGLPNGDALFSIHNGTWTAYIVGSNPFIHFSSSNFTEVEQWAINQTSRGK
jgi:hypothetical protein